MQNLLNRQDDRRCFRDYVIPEVGTNGGLLRHFCKRSLENVNSGTINLSRDRHDFTIIS